MRYLYHYSGALYEDLRTREKQNLPKTGTHVATSDYDKHISFFLEPIPLDILPAIHFNKHPFYVAGSDVYEYKVMSTALGEMRYYLTESPEKTKLLYDTSIDDETYYKQIEVVNKANRYTGTSMKDLESLVDRFQGKTREAFIKVPSYPNYEENKTKYAPCVPHFMIFPKKGIVHYSDVKKKQFGHKRPSGSPSIILNW